MANRLVGNLFIIDSSIGANSGLSLPQQAKILGIGFWGVDTSSQLLLTIGETANSLIRYSNVTQAVAAATGGGITISPAWQYTYFGGFYVQDTLRVNILTAGTGYIYFA